ncbi:hypothetical protein SNEBB_001281 [Seison nebaliae]|nr:hypothetical protein SNEBB_001281 [Seison nebaliae]
MSYSGIPKIIKDVKNSGELYSYVGYLGKGGFAKCYEYKKVADEKHFAIKVINMEEKKYRSGSAIAKLYQEVSIHRSIDHTNIIKFQSAFRDNSNWYIVLELCEYGTLADYVKHHKKLSQYEARFFLFKLFTAVEYLHHNRIIHRDLKLTNVFLNDDLIPKIGDFGLATVVKTEDDEKHTLCGTPNYIAPEILSKIGHGQQVDIWSLGCILYYLLMGKAPFETMNIVQTYSKIRKGDYLPPTDISDDGCDLIHQLLEVKPESRPSATKSLNDKLEVLSDDTNQFMKCRKKLKVLKNFLKEILSSKSSENISSFFQNKWPPIWIKSWIDMSHRFGFGFFVNDAICGASFNDSTVVLMNEDASKFRFINRSDDEELNEEKMRNKDKKKFSLVNQMKEYMEDNLKFYNEQKLPSNTKMDVYVRIWQRTKNGITIFLSNGILQTNFSSDHSKIIIDPNRRTINYIQGCESYEIDIDKRNKDELPEEILSRVKYMERKLCDFQSGKEHIIQLKD